MPEEGLIEVEVAYALPLEQLLIPLRLRQGVTAAEAVEQSGIRRRFPSIDPASVQLGVFGKAVTPDRVLRDGDRVEIYRPLIADPKTQRRQRAARARHGKAR